MRPLFKIRFRDQQGYTIVEMLVASALLVAVLIPTLLYLGKTVHNTKARDLITASQLARERMEKTIARSDYENLNETVRMNHTDFLIRQEIAAKNELVQVTIGVFRANSNVPLTTVKNLRMIR